MSNNRPSQYITVLLAAVIIALAGCGGEQDGPPSAGEILEFTNITPTSLTVNWTKSTDDNTLQQYLEYKVVYHVADLLGTADSALKYGRDVPLLIENEDGEEKIITWVQDNTAIDVKDLDDGIEYYFNVVVRDRYWNATAYIPTTAKTVDITAPEPGNAGELKISDETVESESGTISLILSWTKASDNNTSGPTVLEYRVVYSTKNNIRDVNSALDNDMTPPNKQVWTTDIDTTADIADDYISGLPYDICHYFNVLVRDEAGNTAIYQTKSQTPEPGDDGALTINNEEPDNLRLNWTKATDSDNDASVIEYRVVYSTIDNIDSMESAEANDESGVVEWYPDIDHKDIILPSAGTYYFNVIVKDIAGIKAVYETVTNVPVPTGSLRISDAEPTSLILNWNRATDNGFDSDHLSSFALEYKVVQSTSNNIKTVEHIEIQGNGTVIQDWDEYPKSGFLAITGLDPDTDYYFNVLVKDPSENMDVYGIVRSMASTREPDTEALSRVFSMVLGSAVISAGTDSENSAGSPSGINTSETMEEDVPFYTDIHTGYLVLWLDGYEISGNGTSFEGRPEVWEDKSMHGNNAVQSVPDKRPATIYSPDFNHRPVVRFDKARGDTMVIDFSDSSIPSDDYTVFLVVDSEDASYTYEDHVDLNNPTVISIVNDEKPTLFPGLITNEDTNFGLNSLTLGFAPTYDTETSAVDFNVVDIAEIIVFNRRLTTDEHDNIRSYLSIKWGISP